MNIQDDLISKLMQDLDIDKGNNKVELIETNISWVILIEDFAYKFKKPSRYNFINAEKIEDRFYLCEEEIRLNRRLTKNMYIDMVKIISSNSKLAIKKVKKTDKENNLEGILEVGVKMNRFPRGMLLEELLKTNQLNLDHFSELAKKLACFHLSLNNNLLVGKKIKEDYYYASVYDNLNELENSIADKRLSNQLNKHKIWLHKERLKLEKLFINRLDSGVIRECHGDLHCGNIFLNRENKLTPFDSLDFNETLRWIDPISEVSFLYTDLISKDRKKEAICFLNEWLQQTGDYSGLVLWRWYSSYRLLVKAKVSAIKAKELSALNYNIEKTAKSTSLYINHAQQQENLSKPMIILLHGLTGSGKSYISKCLYTNLHAIWIRSDVERQRVFKLSYSHKILAENYNSIQSDIDLPEFKCDRYHQSVSDWIFHYRIPHILEYIIGSGFNAIVDACFLKEKERNLIYKLANKYSITMRIINCHCDTKTAYSRILRRKIEAIDPSEGSIEVHKMQESKIEKLTLKELPMTLNYNSASTPKALVSELKKLINFEK